jgi:hypothetical protein
LGFLLLLLLGFAVQADLLVLERSQVAFGVHCELVGLRLGG